MATTRRKTGKGGAMKSAAEKALAPGAKPRGKGAEAKPRGKGSGAKPRGKGPGASSSSTALQKVAFTMFPVEDAARARAFYEEVLGLRRGLASANGMWTEYDLPGGGCLALFCHPQAAGKPGGASIAFEVSDLDALNARLRAAGVTYRGDVVHGPNCRMSNIVDSEGNGIILHQLTRAP